MNIIWLGHSCFVVESAGWRVVLDPYYVETYPALHIEADEALCSHGHRDHAFLEAVTLSGRDKSESPFTVETVSTFHDDKKGSLRGENAIHILSANEFLFRVNVMDADQPDSETPLYVGKKVIVVGGGNTAMDSCRTAKRLGAERVMIVYRRSEAEMPARLEEVKHAKEEGIEFLTLHNPLEYIADEKGAVKQVVLQKMQLGEPDASGRRSPEPIPGATETLDIDMAIVAVGVSPNPIVPTSIQGLELGRKNTIVVNEGMQTNIPCIFAGGDIVRGGATVILAMGDGRKAASSMHEYLQK